MVKFNCFLIFISTKKKDGKIQIVCLMCFLVVKCVLVASPGFVKDQFIAYLFKEAVRQDCKILLENRSKFMLVHSSSGHKYSLKGQSLLYSLIHLSFSFTSEFSVL